MQPRTVVITALVIAALLAGVLIYGVNPKNPDNPTVTPTTTPVAFFSPFVAASPTPAIFNPPRITDQAARTYSPVPSVTSVHPSAKTGPEDYLLPGLLTMIVAGGFGVVRQFRRAI